MHLRIISSLQTTQQRMQRKATMRIHVVSRAQLAFIMFHPHESVQPKREDQNWESFWSCAGQPTVSSYVKLPVSTCPSISFIHLRPPKNHGCSLVEVTNQLRGQQHAINFSETKIKSKDLQSTLPMFSQKWPCTFPRVIWANDGEWTCETTLYLWHPSWSVGARSHEQLLGNRNKVLSGLGTLDDHQRNGKHVKSTAGTLRSRHAFGSRGWNLLAICWQCQ